MSELFAAVAQALRPKGCFAFTTETGADSWRVLVSGRFPHADAYVRATSEGLLDRLDQQSLLLWREGLSAAEGALHVLRRRA